MFPVLLLSCLTVLPQASSSAERTSFRTVSGRLLDPAGEPIRGRCLQLVPAALAETSRLAAHWLVEYEEAAPSILRAVTSQDGRFAFSGLGSGPYRLAPQGTRAPADWLARAFTGSPQDLEFVLAEHRLHLHVADESGAPVPDARLQHRAGKTPSVPSAWVRGPAYERPRQAHSAYLFRIDPEEPGWYGVRSRERGFAEARLVLEPGRYLHERRLVLPKVGDLGRVHLRATENPYRFPDLMRCWKTQALSPNSGLVVWQTDRDDRHPFRVQLPEGDWLLRVLPFPPPRCGSGNTDESYEPILSLPVTVRAGSSQDLAFTPLRGGAVYLQPRDLPEHASFFSLELSVYLESDPHVSRSHGLQLGLWDHRSPLFQRFPAGTHQLLIEAPGYAPVRCEIQVRDGGTTRVPFELVAVPEEAR